MPRQRLHHGRAVYVFPCDLPQRLECFKEASGLSWAETARRLWTYPLTIRRWRAGVRPDAQHLLALSDLADGLELGRLLRAERVRRVVRHGMSDSAERNSEELAEPTGLPRWGLLHRRKRHIGAATGRPRRSHGGCGRSRHPGGRHRPKAQRKGKLNNMRPANHGAARFP